MFIFTINVIALVICRSQKSWKPITSKTQTLTFVEDKIGLFGTILMIIEQTLYNRDAVHNRGIFHGKIILVLNIILTWNKMSHAPHKIFSFSNTRTQNVKEIKRNNLYKLTNERASTSTHGVHAASARGSRDMRVHAFLFISITLISIPRLRFVVLKKWKCTNEFQNKLATHFKRKLWPKEAFWAPI